MVLCDTAGSPPPIPLQEGLGHLTDCTQLSLCATLGWTLSLVAPAAPDIHLEILELQYLHQLTPASITVTVVYSEAVSPQAPSIPCPV